MSDILTERAASAPLDDVLDQIRIELGPWRGHSAVKRVIVSRTNDHPDGVSIVFEVSALAAARCQLPAAMWIGALGGRLVPIKHTALEEDTVDCATSVRVVEQRRRSAHLSPYVPPSPVLSMPSPLLSPSPSSSSSFSSAASSPLQTMPLSPQWQLSSPLSSTASPIICHGNARATKTGATERQDTVPLSHIDPPNTLSE